MGIAAAIMTAFYSARLIFMTFHGEPRASKEVMSHVHESPSVMLTPLIVLAVGAVFSGAVFYQSFVGGAHHAPAHEVVPHAGDDHAGHDHSDHGHAETKKAEAHHDEWTKEDFWQKSLFVLPENDTVEAAHSVPYWVKKLPIVMGVVGLLLGWLLYNRFTGLPAFFTKIFKPLHLLFFRKWFFDEIYNLSLIHI